MKRPAVLLIPISALDLGPEEVPHYEAVADGAYWLTREDDFDANTEGLFEALPSRLAADEEELADDAMSFALDEVIDETLNESLHGFVTDEGGNYIRGLHAVSMTALRDGFLAHGFQIICPFPTAPDEVELAARSESIRYASQLALPDFSEAVPDAETLLSAFDGLHHDGRMRTLGLLARDHGEAPEMDDLIATLQSGDTFEAYLAVRLAGLCGRTEALERALSSESRLVKKSAEKHLARHADKDADADSVPEVTDLAAELASFREKLKETAREERYRLWISNARFLQRWAEQYPGELLSLIRENEIEPGNFWFFTSVLHELTRQRPEEVIALVGRREVLKSYSWKWVLSGFFKASAELPVDLRKCFARQAGELPEQLAAFLACFAPSERGALFEAVRARQGAQPPWSRSLLEVLPRAQRISETRSILARSSTRRDRALLIELQGYLPYDEALENLKEFVGSPEAEERGLALRTLIVCAGQNRVPMAGALSVAQKIKNDQDPVRLAVYEGLSSCPAQRYSDDDVALLQGLVESAFEAGDTSYSTRRALQRFAVSILETKATRPESALFAFGLYIVERLFEYGIEPLIRLEKRLPQSAVAPLVDVILPRIRASMEREDFRMLFVFVNALGQKAYECEPLQKLLEVAIEARPDGIARRAIEYWLRPPMTRDARVVELLRRDQSTFTLMPVFDHLHRRRQDLLDQFLNAAPPSGRFASGNVFTVRDIRGGSFRWLPRQQRTYTEILSRLINDKEALLSSRLWAIETLPLLFTTELDDLRPLIERENVNICEAALRAASRLDKNGQVPFVLASYAGSDRARVAVYALSRCLRDLGSEERHALLRQMLEQKPLKVTAEKEILRLLGQFPCPQNLELLFAHSQKENLHRDVKIALGSVANGHLDSEQAWRIVEELAEDTDPYVLESLVRTSPYMRRAWALRYLDILLSLFENQALEDPAPLIKKLASWGHVDGEKIFRQLAGMITDLDVPSWQSACETVAALFPRIEDSQPLLALVDELVQQVAEEPLRRDDERDLPTRQRLHYLVERLTGVKLTRPDPDQADARSALLNQIAETLSLDPTLVGLRRQLRLAAIRWDRPDAALEDLTTLLAELPSLSLSPDALLPRIESATSTLLQTSPGELEEICARTAASPEPRLRRFTTAILRRIGPATYWPPHLVAILQELRRDEDPTVRGEALGLFVRLE